MLVDLYAIPVSQYGIKHIKVSKNIEIGVSVEKILTQKFLNSLKKIKK